MLNSALNYCLGLTMQTVEPKIDIDQLKSRLLKRPVDERSAAATYLVVGEGVEENGKPKVDVLSNELTYEQAQEFTTGVAHGYKVDDVYITQLKNERSIEMSEIQRLLAIGKLAIVPTNSEMQYKNFMYVNEQNVCRTAVSAFDLESDSAVIEETKLLFGASSRSVAHFNDEFKHDLVATLLIAFHVAHSGNTQIVLCGLDKSQLNGSLALVAEKYTDLISKNHFFAPYFSLCSEEVIKSNKLENIGTMVISSDEKQLLIKEMPHPTLLIINTRSPNFADKDYLKNLKAKQQNRTTLFI
jgi:hypothetical protein